MSHRENEERGIGIMTLLRIIFFLLLLILAVAAICEGVYLLLGNGVLGRIVCTVALVAIVPLFMKLFAVIVSGRGKESGE